jgi:exopolysaccharide biosynthesis polyprenyl glycosylphosphotransferase
MRAVLVISDVVVMLAAFASASVLRFGAGWVRHWTAIFDAFPLVLGLGIGSVVAIFAVQGLYDLSLRWTLRDELLEVGRVGLAIAALTLAGLFAVNADQVSRLFLATFFPLVAAGVATGRVAVRASFRQADRRGRGARQILMVGSGPLAHRYLDRALLEVDYGVRVIGYVGPESDTLPLERIGGLADLPRVLMTEVVDEVVIAMPLVQGRDIDFALTAAEEQGKAARIPLHLREEAIAGARIESVGRTPTLTISNDADRSLPRIAKRAIDVVLASLALLGAAPLMLVVAAAIAVTDGRPVIFRQRRTGLQGRDFPAYKFRTMVRDAEERKAALQSQNERTGPVFKIAEDPRVTPLGRFLRKTSIDELPQLVNVVKGEMSLVGPRPATLDEVERYAPWHRRRLSVKPGITGLWQISGRNDPDFDNWVALALAYIDDRLARGDLRQLVTPPVARLRPMAYRRGTRMALHGKAGRVVSISVREKVDDPMRSFGTMQIANRQEQP